MGFGSINNILVHENDGRVSRHYFFGLKYERRKNKTNYHTHAIITRGLYTFYPLFEVQKHFFKGRFCGLLRKAKLYLCTGKYLSEALIFASTNPQHDDRLLTELPVQYMKITRSEHVENMLRTC